MFAKAILLLVVIATALPHATSKSYVRTDLVNKATKDYPPPPRPREKLPVIIIGKDNSIKVHLDGNYDITDDGTVKDIDVDAAVDEEKDADKDNSEQGADADVIDTEEVVKDQSNEKIVNGDAVGVEKEDADEDEGDEGNEMKNNKLDKDAANDDIGIRDDAYKDEMADEDGGMSDAFDKMFSFLDPEYGLREFDPEDLSWEDEGDGWSEESGEEVDDDDIDKDGLGNDNDEDDY